ncbi:MAG: ribonuclease HII [Anaerolineales bacterium]|nr:ribonuclease HII [Anaerolineales bacterium]
MPPKKFDRSLLPPAPDLSFESELWAAGVGLVAGIDEAGRGALAGPVAAGAVILPMRNDLAGLLAGVRDSKQISAKARREQADLINAAARGAAVGFASPSEIDQLGIMPATRMAALRALAQLPEPPQHLLIDHITIPGAGLPSTSLTKGDCRALSIAAASILAKVARDAVMVQLDGEYPGYGFAENKGYGTAGHRQAIEDLGPCPLHRMSFAPISKDQQPRLFG